MEVSFSFVKFLSELWYICNRGLRFSLINSGSEIYFLSPLESWDLIKASEELSNLVEILISSAAN